MPRVIEEMVKAGMISHENVVKLGKHVLRPSSERGLPIITSGDEMSNALEEGIEAGIVEEKYRGNHQSPTYDLRQKFVPRLKAYLAEHRE